ncbi:MAG: hypothetical protein EXR49_04630 [Dehalococcoidia bacterium]|nr:hypothetical protein [Dehalococcoidia bacterium]
MRTPKRLIPFLLVPAVIGATIFAGVAAAQNSDTSGQSNSAPTATATPKPRPAGKIEDVLKKLVTDGVITQAQADKIVATALGMEPAALVKELMDGKTLGEIIAAHGATVDKVVAAVMAPVEERVAKSVADGKMTQEQAGKLLVNFEANVKKHIENFKLPGKPLANNGRGKGDRPVPGERRGPALEQREKLIEKFRERLSDDDDDDKPARRPARPQAPANTPTPSATSGSNL